MKKRLAGIGAKIITIGSWTIIAGLLGTLGLAAYGLYLLGTLALIAIPSICLLAVPGAFLALYNVHEKRSRIITTYAPPPAPAIEGPGLEPEYVDIHTWTVRRAPGGSWAALPIDDKGNLFWNMAIGFNADSMKAWDIANEKRREIGWIH